MLYYLGNSEKGTGNWCFKDGTISFQDIFNRKKSLRKLLTIVSDCSYSGQWVRECAKTLDSLGIPPCGHRAREKRALVKVFASCQPDQEAAEPCHSVEGVRVRDDGSITHNIKQSDQQRSTLFDSTKLACCRGPDSPCPKNTFRHLTWENTVDNSTSIQLLHRKKRGRDKWYFLLLHRAGDAFYAEFLSRYMKNPSLELSDWGYRLESGEGKEPPEEIKDKVRTWTRIFT